MDRLFDTLDSRFMAKAPYYVVPREVNGMFVASTDSTLLEAAKWLEISENVLVKPVLKTDLSELIEIRLGGNGCINKLSAGHSHYSLRVINNVSVGFKINDAAVAHRLKGDCVVQIAPGDFVSLRNLSTTAHADIEVTRFRPPPSD